MGQVVIPLERSVVERLTQEGATDVTFGFRPESVHVGGPDGEGLRVVVNVVEELGSDAYLYGSLVGPEAEEEGVPNVIIARADPRHPPKKGDQVTLTIRQGEEHVFSTASGARISV